MRKIIYTVAAITFCNLLSAQAQQTITLQPEKTTKGTPSTSIMNSKEVNPNTTVEPAITYSTANFIPSTALSPTIIPSVSNVVEPKKSATKSNPK